MIKSTDKLCFVAGFDPRIFCATTTQKAAIVSAVDRLTTLLRAFSVHEFETEALSPVF
jgi:hypothetical protein